MPSDLIFETPSSEFIDFNGDQIILECVEAANQDCPDCHTSGIGNR